MVRGEGRRLKEKDCGSQAEAPIDDIFLTDCGFTKEDMAVLLKARGMQSKLFELQITHGNFSKQVWRIRNSL
jgi:hypothetical protein